MLALVLALCLLRQTLTFQFKSFRQRIPSTSSLDMLLSRLNTAAVVDPEVEAGSEEAEKVTIMPIKRSFRIRTADYTDLEHVVNLRVDVFYPELRGVQSFHDKILSKLCVRREKGAQCLLAESDDGTLLGTIEFSPSDFTETSMQDIGYARKLYLMDLAVQPSARRAGVATRLLDSVQELARIHDFRDVYLHVEVGNDSARLLYAKNGFSEILPLDWAIAFTEQRLRKPWENYVLLFKALW